MIDPLHFLVSDDRPGPVLSDELPHAEDDIGQATVPNRHDHNDAIGIGLGSEI